MRLKQDHPLICQHAQVAFYRAGALWTTTWGIDQADVLLGVALVGVAGFFPARCYLELAGNVADDEAEQQEEGIGSEVFGGVVA